MYQEIPQEQLVKVYVSETFADKQKEEINRLKDRRKLEYLSDHVFNMFLIQRHHRESSVSYASPLTVWRIF